MFRHRTCLPPNLSSSITDLSLVIVALFLCVCTPTANEVDFLSTWIVRTERAPTWPGVAVVSLRGGLGHGQLMVERNVTRNPAVPKPRNTVRRKRAQAETVGDLHEGQEKTSSAARRTAQNTCRRSEISGTLRRKRSQLGAFDAARDSQERQTQRGSGVTKPTGIRSSTVRRKKTQRALVSNLREGQQRSTIQNAETSGRVARTVIGRGGREIVSTVQRKRAHIGVESVLRKGQERGTETADGRDEEEIDSVDSSCEQRFQFSDTVAKKKAQIERTEHVIGKQELVTRGAIEKDPGNGKSVASRRRGPEDDDAVRTLARKKEQIWKLTALREEEERRTAAASAVARDNLKPNVVRPMLDPEPGAPQLTPILRGATESRQGKAAQRGRARHKDKPLKRIAAVIDDITGSPRTRMKRAKQMRRCASSRILSSFLRSPSRTELREFGWCEQDRTAGGGPDRTDSVPGHSESVELDRCDAVRARSATKVWRGQDE